MEHFRKLGKGSIQSLEYNQKYYKHKFNNCSCLKELDTRENFINISNFIQRKNYNELYAFQTETYAVVGVYLFSILDLLSKKFVFNVKSPFRV